MDNDILELRKALDTSSTNGNNVLDPVLLSKIISEQSRRKAMIRNVLPRIPFPGKVYTWDTEIAPGDAQTATDGATLNLVDGQYAQSQAAMSYFYHLGYITNPAIQSAQELVDLVAMRVSGATKAVLRKENSAIFNGDSNNNQFPGLLSALGSGSPNFAGSGLTLSRDVMGSIETNLLGEGYELDAWVVSKGIYNILKEAAFNQVRFMGINGGGDFGFPVAEGLQFNGKPVVMDIYAGNIAAIVNEAVGTGDGSTKAFNLAHIPVNPSGASGLTDQAGVSLSGPVVKIAGTTKANGTDYVIVGKTITFTTAPSGSAAVTASYSYMQENMYALSLNPADICIAELMGLQVDRDLANPVQTDSIPFRVKEYSVLAVRNPNAHALASNIILPSSWSNF